MGQAAQKLNLEPELLSISAIARELKLDNATVRNRLEDLGYEPDESSTPKLKLFPFDDEMRFSIKAAKDSLSAAKIRDIRAASQIKEIKLAEMRGELVPINDTIERIQAVMSKMYKEFTQMQPKRLASRLAKAKTAAEITKVLKLDTDKIFYRLRENDEAFVPTAKVMKR